MRRRHFYVFEDLAKQLREKAEAKNLSVSTYVAETMQRETHAGWPEGYFERNERLKENVLKALEKKNHKEGKGSRHDPREVSQ